VGRHRDDRQMPIRVAFFRAHDRRRFDTVHFRHLDVEDREVEPARFQFRKGSG
jgi:hypothetical protein